MCKWRAYVVSHRRPELDQSNPTICIMREYSNKIQDTHLTGRHQSSPHLKDAPLRHIVFFSEEFRMMVSRKGNEGFYSAKVGFKLSATSRCQLGPRDWPLFSTCICTRRMDTSQSHFFFLQKCWTCA